MTPLLRRAWLEDEAQDIAEYGVMLAMIVIIVIGAIQLIGSHANTAFSNVASSTH
ncbi:MAG: Flp family type IVb pilin [Acidobacteria bacterium]|nr:MAG: Flp family type IVb pilin [Acidobacteriota bacterium]PYY07063.1 MAG: Flp family type IVb pilin [Acidobacteriota bacterium]